MLRGPGRSSLEDHHRWITTAGGSKCVLLQDHFFAGDAGTQLHSPVRGLQGKATSSVSGVVSGSEWLGAILSALRAMWGEGSGTKLLWFPWKNVHMNIEDLWNLYEAALEWHQPAETHCFLVIWLLMLEKDGCLQLCWLHIQWETQVHTTTNLNLQLMLRSLNDSSPRHAAKENTTKIVLS